MSTLNGNVRLINSSVIIKANGKNSVSSVTIGERDQKSNKNVLTETIDADLVLVAGGFNPVVHLDCHTGSNPIMG